jgi:hypothetical protein
MSNDDATGRGEKKALSGLPGPRSGAVSPLQGGPRPDATGRNPFASSDQIEAQRPAPDEGGAENTAGDEPRNEAASDHRGSGEAAGVSSNGDGEEATAKPVPSGPSSAFIDAPRGGGSNVGLIMVGIVAIMAVLAFFLFR